MPQATAADPAVHAAPGPRARRRCPEPSPDTALGITTLPTAMAGQRPRNYGALCTREKRLTSGPAASAAGPLAARALLFFR